MHIPILYHTFDGTGLSVSYNMLTFCLLTIVFAIIGGLIAMIPTYIAYKKESPQESFRQWQSKKIMTIKERIILIILMITITAPLIGLGASNFPLLFTSEAEGKYFYDPKIVNHEDGLYELEFLKSISGHTEKDNIANKYSKEIQEAIKNNEEMKKYHIPGCESYNSDSILCGGDKLKGVLANKGDKIVSLVPHYSLKEEDAQISLDNPQDKGLPVYFYIEEKTTELYEVPNNHHGELTIKDNS